MTRCGSARPSSSPDEDDRRRMLMIVGDDETDAARGTDRLERAARPRTGWRAHRRRADRSPPAGEKSYEVVGITLSAHLGDASERRPAAAARPASPWPRPRRSAASAATAACCFIVPVDGPPRRPARIGVAPELVERASDSRIVGADRLVRVEHRARQGSAVALRQPLLLNVRR